MNLTKLIQALAALTQWVKDGLATKQTKVLVTSLTPSNAEGTDGDLCVIVDGS